jgi:hypothetical protein
VETSKEANRSLGRRKTFAYVLAGLGVLIWLGAAALDQHYMWTRPSVESRLEGRVYVHNNHGYYTYLTAQEHYSVVLLGIAAVALVLTGFLMDRWRR